MENQIFGLTATLWIFPVLFFFISLAWAHSKNKFALFFGKLPTISRGNVLLIVQTLALLLLASLLIDKLAFYFGVNDTAGVANAAAVLARVPLTTIFFLAFGALAEEMFFRGSLFAQLGKWPSIVLFALAHAGYFSVIEVAGAFVAALILTHARQRSKSIFPGTVAHILYNLAAVFILSQV